MAQTKVEDVVISGTGLWTPEHSISNEELVTSYNAWAERYNQLHSAEIEAGSLTAKPFSSAEFIAKASGIHSRYIYMKDGVLDIDRMRPRIPERADDELSDQAEIGLKAAQAAMQAANKAADDIDAVIVSCAYTQRSYPAIAIEIQQQLGIKGFGFDMLVACSAATFALQRATEMVVSGMARSVLVISPELISSQINYCDRDSHFIFGDVATAVIIERAETAQSDHMWAIKSIKAETVFSNNIRSNFGFMSRSNDAEPYTSDKLFHQNGRKVFKEVCPMAVEHLTSHLASLEQQPADVRRWWLHQANINMNTLIAKRLMGELPSEDKAPIILNEYANTASAGSIIAFHLHQQDLQSGDLGMICSFGAGYSIGSLILEKF
ncbi:MAG: beta-ketoacyl-ACP synthase III [bacterium]